MSKIDNDLIDAAELTESRFEDAQSGRVTFDERGNGVWEWHLETGEYSTDITSTQMNRIVDPSALQLADDTVKLRIINNKWIYQSDRR
ncbi:MAG TPA: hypothetical protein VG962_06410 [Steroidobacteraceae bacterium]|nr:hypothetical protein [Steroidobacteraceae bacterium]